MSERRTMCSSAKNGKLLTTIPSRHRISARCAVCRTICARVAPRASRPSIANTTEIPITNTKVGNTRSVAVSPFHSAWFMDGGIRRGADVVRALARGANAVLIGRPYLYGLAVNGSTGVQHVVEILRRELEAAMALTGRTSIARIDRGVLWPEP